MVWVRLAMACENGIIDGHAAATYLHRVVFGAALAGSTKHALRISACFDKGEESLALVALDSALLQYIG